MQCVAALAVRSRDAGAVRLWVIRLIGTTCDPRRPRNLATTPTMSEQRCIDLTRERKVANGMVFLLLLLVSYMPLARRSRRPKTSFVWLTSCTKSS